MTVRKTHYNTNACFHENIEKTNTSNKQNKTITAHTNSHTHSHARTPPYTNIHKHAHMYKLSIWYKYELSRQYVFSLTP